MELKQLPWLMSVGTGLQRILPEAYEKWAGQINSWFSETTIKGQQDFDVAKKKFASGNTAGQRGQYVLTHMLFPMVAVKTLEWLCKTAIM